MGLNVRYKAALWFLQKKIHLTRLKVDAFVLLCGTALPGCIFIRPIRRNLHKVNGGSAFHSRQTLRIDVFTYFFSFLVNLTSYNRDASFFFSFFFNCESIPAYAPMEILTIPRSDLWHDWSGILTFRRDADDTTIFAD